MSGGNVKTEQLVVVGLGYVGLPLAVALAEHFDVVGLDISAARVDELQRFNDRTGEISADRLAASRLTVTTDPTVLTNSSFVIVTVPTPVDDNKSPDLGALRGASEMIGGHVQAGTVVVYESTVYPGATEEVCLPILEQKSGLRLGVDLFLGYSPERINPGDTTHTIDRVIKVVSGSDDQTLERVSAVYERICHAGLHKAPSIRVAEAAKVIENTQRDLNIALMNELALVFDRLNIRTSDVLAAAGTKWNFLPFVPGLVGGHCIGVDPYYLTYKAQAVGYQPEVILAGRRVNDQMGAFIAQKTLKLLARTNEVAEKPRIAILGMTFKENIPDLRNSRVPDIVRELLEFSIEPIVHDPEADSAESVHEYGVELSTWPLSGPFDAVILAVPHRFYLERLDEIAALLRPGGLCTDLKSVVDPVSEAWRNTLVWSL